MQSLSEPILSPPRDSANDGHFGEFMPAGTSSQDTLLHVAASLGSCNILKKVLRYTARRPGARNGRYKLTYCSMQVRTYKLLVMMGTMIEGVIHAILIPHEED